jgi:hypothetical protein
MPRGGLRTGRAGRATTPPGPVGATPAGHSAPRRRRRGLFVGAGAAVAVLAVGGVAAASTVLKSEPDPPLNVGPTEQAVKAKVADQTPVKAVRCPRALPALPSIKFACTVTLDNDQQLIAIVDHRGGKDTIALRLR